MPGIDYVHLQPVSAGLQVVAEPRELAYPIANDVRIGVIYGYDGQYTGALNISGNPPTPAQFMITPTITGVDIAINAATSTTNIIFIKPLSGTDWFMAGNVENSGALSLSLQPGSYWAYVQTQTSTGYAQSAPQGFAVHASGVSPESELRQALRARILATPELPGQLGSPEAVYYARLPGNATLPAIVFRQEQTRRLGSAREFIYSIQIYAREQLELERLLRLLCSGGLNGGLTTLSWSVRSCELVNDTGDTLVIDGEGSNAYQTTLQLRIFTYPSTSYCRLVLNNAPKDNNGDNYIVNNENIGDEYQTADTPPENTAHIVELLLPPPISQRIRQEREQASGETLDGSLYVYDRGRNESWLELELCELTSTELTGLIDFFQNHARARAEIFNYYDEYGQALAVRFGETRLDFIRKQGGVYDTTLKLVSTIHTSE